MKDIIYSLRQQPEEVRRQVLHIMTFIMGVILFGLWVYSLGSGFKSEEIETDAQANSPGLKANVLEGYEDLNDF